MNGKIAERQPARKRASYEDNERAAGVVIAALHGQISISQAIHALRWDGPVWSSPQGEHEHDADLRGSWCLRSGLEVPAWCATDPRLTAADVLVCAVLDALADDAGLVRVDDDALAGRLRLTPAEVPGRLAEPLERLRTLGIATPIRGGGWLLRRLAIAGEVELDDAHVDALAEWAHALPAEERAIVAETLYRVAAGGSL